MKRLSGRCSRLWRSVRHSLAPYVSTVRFFLFFSGLALPVRAASVSPENVPVVIWLEAEHAVAANFTDIYPALGLSGGRGLHFSTSDFEQVARFTARFRFSVSKAGRYVLWSRRHLLYIDTGRWPLIDRLHRYIGMEWRVDDGPWRRPVVEPSPINTQGRYPSSIGHLGFTRTGDAETAGQYIGWYLDEAVDLTGGDHTFQVRFHVRQTTMTPLLRPGSHRYYGILDAFAFAEPGFVPRGRIAPDFARLSAPPPDPSPPKQSIAIGVAASADTLPGVPGLSLVPDDPRLEAKYRDLHLGLIRLTHLYNLAEVSVNDSGRLSIDWTRLDSAVDHIFKLGSEPLMCIGYTPAVLSTMPPDTPRGPVAGDPGLYAPSDYALWEEVVYRTVRHCNVERGLNIRYWEVWNEPNNTFLQVWPVYGWTDKLPLIGATLEYVKKLIIYCNIYEHAARGAVRADPSIRIGGPTALCDGDVGDITGSAAWFVKAIAWWCAWRDLRLDFISLHLYAGSPDSISPEDYGQLIRSARRWAKVGNRAPEEVIIDEWNVFSMEGGHDTVTEYHAVWVMESLSAMMQAGARRNVYFGSGAGWPGLFDTERYTPTPAYNLFRMLAMLEPARIPAPLTHGDVRLIASRSQNRITVLAWRFGTTPVDVEWLLPDTGFGDRRPVRYRRFLIDAQHSNLRSPSQQAELEMVEEGRQAASTELRWTTRLPATSMTLLTFEPADQRED